MDSDQQRCFLKFTEGGYHLLYHFKSGRTVLHVLFVHMDIVDHFLLRQMREACTICRADRIDGAHIGYPVEELAGLTAVHPFSFAILVQPFFTELRDRHSEMRSDPLQVLESEGGRHFSAAVRAGEAVHFFPDLFFDLD